MTIHVIEKQAHLRQLIQLELSDASLDCFCVATSDEAHDVLMFEKVDVVVLGVGWPSQEDLHTLCWLKSFFPDLPIVLFAGEEDLQPKSIARLADVWVEKSSRIDLLLVEIQRFKQKMPLRLLTP
ncbi:MAG: hypothetical protein ACO36I_22870 [Candidatus Latescibacterota bacterium]